MTEMDVIEFTQGVHYLARPLRYNAPLMHYFATPLPYSAPLVHYIGGAEFSATPVCQKRFKLRSHLQQHMGNLPTAMSFIKFIQSSSLCMSLR